MNFIFDNNLSPKLSKAISALEGDNGNAVFHVRDRFPASTPDEEWITALASQGLWNVITCDRHISRNPIQLRAWRESGFVIFFLKSCWLNIDFWEMSWKIVKKWPLIVNTAQRSTQGTGYLVSIRSNTFQEMTLQLFR